MTERIRKKRKLANQHTTLHPSPFTLHPKKYLLIWDRLGDYHRARVRALRDLVGGQNVLTSDLGAADELYQWGNTGQDQLHYQLSQKTVDQSDLCNRVKKYRRILKEQGIDVVTIAGYGRPEYVLMMVYARLIGRKVILFAESWYPGNIVFDKLKGWILSFLVDGFFVSGIRAEKHFHQRLGIPLDRIVKGYSVVDNDHFRQARECLAAKEFSPYLLCVARYSEEKNLPFLIEAYRRSNKYQKWHLVLIGDGPQKEALQRLIHEDRDWIHLLGWKSYDELPGWYQQAEAVLLPSSFEPWGLVVNEALAAGVRVLASTACGCVDDLLADHPVNIFDPQDPDGLVKVLNNLAEKEKNSDPYVILEEQYSCKAWARNLIKLSC
jgi:1,2-diacylglycerol 3-alpha-glucosyltransferase